MIVSVWTYGAGLLRYQQALTAGQSGLSFRSWVRLYGFFSFLVILSLTWAAGVLLHWPVFTGMELLLTLALFTYGYLAYWDPSYFLLPPLTRSIIPDKPEFDQYDDAIEWQRVQDLFQQKAIYVQPKLTVDDVARYLNLPARYVSYLINYKYSANFNQYVNQQRVAEVIRKMNNPKEQHKTLLALALEAGFNSKSTFNQVFKQHTGHSPSGYLTSQKSRDNKPSVSE